MSITIPELEAANPAALSQAGERSTAAAAAAHGQVVAGQQMLTSMSAGWRGTASDAAAGEATKNLKQHEDLQNSLQRIGSTLQSGAGQLTESRTAILTYVGQLKSQGWQVADDGTVSVRSDGPLAQYAKTSPFGRMQLLMLATKASAELKVKLAQFSALDEDLAKKLKEIAPLPQEPAGPEQPKPTEPKPEEPKPEEPKPEEPNERKNPAEAAAEYEGRDAEELKRSGDLPMNPNVDSDVCCANFVTAVLQKEGYIDWHTDLVATAYTKLQDEGWTPVDAAHAKPGAVAVINGRDGTGNNDHIEFVHSNDNGTIKLIGSNNVNPDGTQKVTIGNPYGDVVYLNPPG